MSIRVLMHRKSVHQLLFERKNGLELDHMVGPHENSLASLSYINFAVQRTTTGDPHLDVWSEAMTGSRLFL